MGMKEKLIQFCNELKIEYVGIAPVGPYKELEDRIKERYETGHITGFENKDIKALIDPRETMKDAKSVIVCLFPYYTGQSETTNIAMYAHGKDYHIIIKKKLDIIGEQMKKEIRDFNYMSFVDTGPLNDRYMAYLAGLGYYGLNNNIINDKYGSYILIGYIINNYPFEIDVPCNKECQKCGACIRLCPGNAIKDNYTMDSTKCLSFITQKREAPTEEEIGKLKAGKMIFGCDLCQKVCPHNLNPQNSELEEFYEDLITSINEEDIKDLSNKSFKEKYGDRAFAWRGKKVLLKNIEHMKD